MPLIGPARSYFCIYRTFTNSSRQCSASYFLLFFLCWEWNVAESYGIQTATLYSSLPLKGGAMFRKRVLTGMRTTGALHLGHYVGALERWVEIQNSGEYECFFLLADVQALTTHADRPAILTQSVRDVILDWLAVGLDPTLPHVHFVLQSQVLERYELSALLGMVTPFSKVMRDPTLKSELKSQPNATIGFVNYPVDQAADILMVSHTPPREGDKLLVPVGRDQLPHLELQREIARAFNRQYGFTFVECEGLVGKVGRLVGTDGSSKMSKSQNNAIFLSDDPRTIETKVRRMFTDSKRVRADIPGDTRNNPVFVYHRAFNPNAAEVSDFGRRYRAGTVGDVEVKQALAEALNNFLDPIRERRHQYEGVNLRELVEAGTQAARIECRQVVSRVRDLMHLKYP